MRSNVLGIESRANRAQRRSVDFCNRSLLSLLGGTALADQLSNNSNEELLCKN
jgi:hypothetical protein